MSMISLAFCGECVVICTGFIAQSLEAQSVLAQCCVPRTCEVEEESDTWVAGAQVVGSIYKLSRLRVLNTLTPIRCMPAVRYQKS